MIVIEESEPAYSSVGVYYKCRCTAAQVKARSWR